MKEKEGVLFFDSLGERYDIRYSDGNTYGGLHCGTVFVVKIGGIWKQTRIEMNEDDEWYLVGLTVDAISGLIASMSIKTTDDTNDYRSGATSKTIKQIADETGKSKTAISKKLDSLGLRQYTVKVGGKIMIDEQTETLLLQAIDSPPTANRKPPTITANRQPLTANYQPQTTNQVGGIVGDYMATLIQQLETKDIQIETKDVQIAELQQTIKELTAALEHTTAGLNGAQALHAATIQKQLADKNPNFDPEQPIKKDNWFKNLFKNWKESV